MKNFVQKSFSMDILAPKAVNAGEPFAFGSFVCIPTNSAAQGELVNVYSEGIYLLNVSVETKIGQPLYFHDKTSTIDATPADSIFCGFSIENAPAGQTKVMLSKCVVPAK